MIDPIIRGALQTWVLMWSTPLVVQWFTVLTVITTAYAMKVNHLNIGRLVRYAGLFVFLFVFIEGPKLTYISVVLKRPMDNPQVWMEPTFVFTVFTCLMLAFTLAFAANVVLDLIFDDFYLAAGQWFYERGDGLLGRSNAFKSVGVASVRDLHRMALEQTATKAATDLQNTAVRAAGELKIVAGTAAEDVKATADSLKENSV